MSTTWKIVREKRLHIKSLEAWQKYCSVWKGKKCFATFALLLLSVWLIFSVRATLPPCSAVEHVEIETESIKLDQYCPSKGYIYIRATQIYVMLWPDQKNKKPIEKERREKKKNKTWIVEQSVQSKVPKELYTYIFFFCCQSRKKQKVAGRPSTLASRVLDTTS